MLGDQGAFCRADDRLHLSWEGIAESCLNLWGVEVTWSHSSVDPTLVPRRTEQLDCIRQLYIAPVSDVTCNQSFVSYASIYELAI